MPSATPHRTLVIGGGAAGFFGAIRCAERLFELEGQKPAAGRVLLCEAGSRTLEKVRVSGGGRCNVTHACFDARELSRKYPRGSRELIGPLSRWGPREMEAWLAARGVELKAEEDGRMFPVTDDSATIVDCLREAAEAAGVTLVLDHALVSAEKLPTGGFRLRFRRGQEIACDRLLIATGGNKDSGGLAVAQALGHAIEPPVPSLFTFKVEDARIAGLSGLSVPAATAQVKGGKLREEGPLLITHWGFSGPAILRLSAWGARELAELGYRFELRINWAPGQSREQVLKRLTQARDSNPKRQLLTWCPVQIPLRLWERLCAAAGLPSNAIWTGASNEALGRLAQQVTEGDFQVLGKATNKDEFVTCGGVRLSEIDFKTMESRKCPGLHFAGEVLDIDGITGGFNFQAAWTTGHFAGQALAEAP